MLKVKNENRMKKKYIEPKMKVIKIDSTDIICTSSDLYQERRGEAPDVDGIEFE